MWGGAYIILASCPDSFDHSERSFDPYLSEVDMHRASLFVWVAALAVCPLAAVSSGDVCGDVNGDGSVSVADVTGAVNYLFRGIPEQPYFRPADVNGDYGVTVADLTWLVSYLFRGGPALECPATFTPAMGDGCVEAWTSTAGGQPNPAVRSSGCLTVAPDDSAEYMFVELVGRDLHVHHVNAYYQCCLGYAATFEIDGRSVTVQEADTSFFPCPCMCYFNLEAILPGFAAAEPGEYAVTLVGLEGDTVGADTLVIGGPETMSLEVVGKDLRVRHLNAQANCCPAFLTDVFVNGGAITVIEWDTLSACDCLCTYNLLTVVNDLEPGDYAVTLIGVCTYPVLCAAIGTDTVTIPGRSAE